MIRSALALWPLSAALLYWLVYFNTYAYIDSRQFVTARPAPSERLAYAASLGMACAAVGGVAVWAVGRNGWLRLIALGVIYTAVLYGVADLNMYVTGFGPEGQDWVKGRSVGAWRLL